MASLFNLCNLSPWAIAAREFNDAPQAIEIQGTWHANHRFFEKLDQVDDPVRRGEMFHEYMCVKFKLHEWDQYESNARRSLRNSYVRYLRGWGLDSNTIEGAVLKGWVQSRLGIPPTYHRGCLKEKEADENLRYAYDRMKGSARTNAIELQLDMVFAFSQYELNRRHPDTTHFTLYRGTHDEDAYGILEHINRSEYFVMMNNLSSFSSDRELAWEFGSTVWKAEIPKVKVFFFSDLLPESILKGENEYLVIGGEYRVKKLLY